MNVEQTVLSAPGKAFLMGEYAVLEGVPAYVTAIGVRAYAMAPQAGERAQLQSSFVSAAVRAAAKHCGVSFEDLAPHCPVVRNGAFRMGARKLGLGSSAAVTVSVLSYLLHLKDRSPEDPQELLALALAAHKEAQGGVGSGGDVAASVLGGLLRVSSQGFESQPWPENLHVAFVDAGQPASTESLVRRVQAAREQNQAAYEAALEELKRGSELFSEQIHAGTVDGAALVEAVRAHNRGLARLGAFSGAVILTPAIESILETAESFNVAAKPSGAGGGDLVVGMSTDRSALDEWIAQLQTGPIPACSSFSGAGTDLGGRAIIELSNEREGLRIESRAPVNSRLRAFFKKSVELRRQTLTQKLGLEPEAFAAVDSGALGLSAAAHMIENVVGLYELPFAVATNFVVNGRDVLVPMCVEEASVVAAASNAARMIRSGGGFSVTSDPPWMITQIQLTGEGQGTIETQVQAILDAKPELLTMANDSHPRLVARGGGARGLEVRILDREHLVVHVLVDCRDAMGANLLNTIAEALAPRLEMLCGRQARLRILSNLADRRVARVRAEIPVEVLKTERMSGQEVALGIQEASRFAELDPYRATTHNKGIMNGVDAVVVATGNDWRAMEASAHAYAVQEGRYRPLAVWRHEQDQIVGELALPVALGVVGGATRTHPGARLALEILEHPSATRLGQIVACTGLASNLAALRALATEGISRGHMQLHAQSVALSAGAREDEVMSVVAAMVAANEIKLERARSHLALIRKTSGSSD